VEESVYDALAQNTSDVNLTFNLILNVDTTGKIIVSIDGNSTLNEQIIKSLNYISFDKYKEKGVFMFTKDVFEFDASKKLKNGQVFLKGENVKFMSVYSKGYEEAVAANKTELDNGRGIYDISVSFIDFNGNATATMTVNSFKEKKSPAYYILGGAVVLGGGAYYGYTLFKNK
jgi:hypothetical protein